jgi:NADH-quinone oxidoreductase subunit N
MYTLVLLSLLGFLVLFLGAFDQKKLLLPVALTGLAAAFVLNAMDWGTNITWFGMMNYDNYAVSFTGLILFILFMLFMLATWHFRNEDSNVADIYALMIFSVTGAMLMTSFTNLVMLFIGIEILSIPLYIMAGSRRLNLSSNEASLKYFLMGAFSSGVLLFGITLVFGVCNSFDLTVISDYVNNSESTPLIFNAGVMMILIGFGFKIGAVPFHFWSPDVYQGAPTLITAFMATVVKTAAIAAFYRLFDTCFSGIDGVWYQIVWVIAIVTILLGNISAVMQNEAKRMLAWSGVANAGYLLIPIIALNETSASTLFYYSAAYSVASITAFAVIMALSGVKNELPVDQFKGLAKNNPLLTTALVVSMFSLAGIPPLAGFFGKYMVFFSAFNSNLIVAVLFAIAGSLIGVYYYFRPVVYSFNSEGQAPEKIRANVAFNLVIFTGIFLSLFLAIFQDFFNGLPG